MSRFYSAGQYNQEFLPKRLGNWEVARWFPDRRPRDPFRFKPTEIIVDDRGHFLPGVPKANRNPWNNYIGSHDLPPRISRAVANDLSSRPPARLRYWDKPNPRQRGVPCVSARLGGGTGPGNPILAEGPGYPQHRNYFLAKQDYAAHRERVEKQDAVAEDFLQERKRRQQADREHVEKVQELARTLRKQQEQQRQADAEQDVQWLIKHRALHNIVPDDEERANGGAESTPPSKDLDQDEDEGIQDTGEQPEESPRGRDRDQEPSVQDDCKDSGVGSVDLQDQPSQPSQPSPPSQPSQPSQHSPHSPPYPQFEENSGDLLKRSNPTYPEVDPAFSRRAARDPTIQSYPQPELLREPGYPEMFTTETDLAAPIDERPESPPPRPQPDPSGLPDLEAAALKCGRNPRRVGPVGPPRPYARAQFSVVAPDSPEPPHTRPTIPALATTYSSFQVAKQLHKENLEHNPLPDTIDDELFKKLNSQRHPNPGVALNVNPDAAAVGWRSFNAPGPTNCSKMRIYRPKTAGPVSQSRDKTSMERLRPSTGHPSKLLAKDHVSEMDLAICWDLVPKFAEDEPQPSPHIDGSNGSAAPGIFSLVHHPSDPDPGEAEERRSSARGGAGAPHSGPRGTSTPPVGNKASPPKPPSLDSVHSSASRQDAGSLHERLGALDRQRNAVRRHENEKVNRNHTVRDNPRDIPAPRTAGLFDRRLRGGCVGGDMASCGDGTSRGDPRNLNDHLAELCKHKHHQSMPDLTQHRRRQSRSANGNSHPHPDVQAGPCRPCAACRCSAEQQDQQQPQLRRPKSEYKMAFKAGKPCTSLSTNSSFDSVPVSHNSQPQVNAAREVRVPKQRAPFARKNYTISSLAQPFSLWPKETGHAYPEHWRLASVYQHSFKPVHLRSKPLLKTVYQ